MIEDRMMKWFEYSHLPEHLQAVWLSKLVEQQREELIDLRDRIRELEKRKSQ